MAEGRTDGAAGDCAVIHQFAFGTFNVAVLGGGETLAMLRRPRGERFCCRGGGSRALLNVWHEPKGN